MRERPFGAPAFHPEFGYLAPSTLICRYLRIGFFLAVVVSAIPLSGKGLLLLQIKGAEQAVLADDDQPPASALSTGAITPFPYFKPTWRAQGRSLRSAAAAVGMPAARDIDVSEEAAQAYAAVNQPADLTPAIDGRRSRIITVRDGRGIWPARVLVVPIEQ